MITIRDLAKRAGVSIATVSRVLNNYPDVSDATRQRVLELAREMDFRPSAAARTLKTRRSHIVGVFFQSDLNHPFFQEVIVGLKRKVGDAGYDLLLFANRQTGDGEQSFVKRARHHRVDGVVMLSIDPNSPAAAQLVATDIPCMSVDLNLTGERSGYVMSDNLTGARQAVDHLHRLGHRRIATITGRAGTCSAQDRLEGYRLALQDLGLPYLPEYVSDGDFTRRGGYSAMQALLALPERPTALFAAGDMMAIGAMMAAREAGLRIPEDLAVVGFDDIRVAELVTPALSTIRQNKNGLGAATGEALIRLIEEPDYEPPRITLPTELVVRESCGGRK